MIRRLQNFGKIELIYSALTKIYHILAIFVIAPTSTGCWIRFPSGCPKQSHQEKYKRFENTTRWHLENYKNASGSKEKCYSRRNAINNWCGISDLMMQYFEGIEI